MSHDSTKNKWKERSKDSRVRAAEKGGGKQTRGGMIKVKFSNRTERYKNDDRFTYQIEEEKAKTKWWKEEEYQATVSIANSDEGGKSQVSSGADYKDYSMQFTNRAKNEINE